VRLLCASITRIAKLIVDMNSFTGLSDGFLTNMTGGAAGAASLRPSSPSGKPVRERVLCIVNYVTLR
jgi:hypothetical protein